MPVEGKVAALLEKLAFRRPEHIGDGYREQAGICDAVLAPAARDHKQSVAEIQVVFAPGIGRRHADQLLESAQLAVRRRLFTDMLNVPSPATSYKIGVRVADEPAIGGTADRTGGNRRDEPFLEVVAFGTVLDRHVPECERRGKQLADRTFDTSTPVA